MSDTQRLLERAQGVLDSYRKGNGCGKPVLQLMEDSHQGAIWLTYQQACGHDFTYILAKRNQAYGELIVGLVGQIIEPLTEEQALQWFAHRLKNIPAVRKRFISEIRTDTLDRIVHGEQIFCFEEERHGTGEQKADANDLWTVAEIVYGRMLFATSNVSSNAYRAFDMNADDSNTRCICAPKEMHANR